MLVFCTVPDEKAAKAISSVLVKEGLCACVNQVPKITSYYIYDGEFCEDNELLLLIKTAPSHFKKLQARLNELHPYDVPEIIGIRISEISPAYHKWLLTALK